MIEEFRDLEADGFELAGVMEFYENPETGEGKYRSVLFTTSMEKELENEEEYTDGQKMLLVTLTMFEDYLNREAH